MFSSTLKTTLSLLAENSRTAEPELVDLGAAARDEVALMDLIDMADDPTEDPDLQVLVDRALR